MSYLFTAVTLKYTEDSSLTILRHSLGLTYIFQIIKLSFLQLGLKENNGWLDNRYITLQYQYISPSTFTIIINLTDDSLGNFLNCSHCVPYSTQKQPWHNFTPRILGNTVYTSIWNTFCEILRMYDANRQADTDIQVPVWIYLLNVKLPHNV